MGNWPWQKRRAVKMFRWADQEIKGFRNGFHRSERDPWATLEFDVILTQFTRQSHSWNLDVEEKLFGAALTKFGRITPGAGSLPVQVELFRNHKEYAPLDSLTPSERATLGELYLWFRGEGAPDLHDGFQVILRLDTRRFAALLDQLHQHRGSTAPVLTLRIREARSDTAPDGRIPPFPIDAYWLTTLPLEVARALRNPWVKADLDL